MILHSPDTVWISRDVRVPAVAHELAGLVGDLVEDVGDEGVHD